MEFARKLFSDIQTKYPELKDVKLEEINKHDQKLIDLYGYTDADVMQESSYILIGKEYRTLKMSPKYIYIRTEKDDDIFSNNKVMYILLHEIAHCLTPYVQQREGKRKWVEEYHSFLYYANLAKVNRKAKELGYPIDSKMFDIKILERNQRIHLNM